MTSKTILDQFTFIEDLDYLIHPAVRDFLRLPADVEDQLKKAPYEVPAQTFPPIEDEKPDQKTDQPDYQELLAELKTATKRREFKKVLKRLDFFFLRYGNGSHEIWSSRSGTTVVLPFHNGSDPLKPGTHQAVVKKVAISLGTDDS
jgi:predicted RNA binding protein YcfA (HicA-like mRNA interferase family)